MAMRTFLALTVTLTCLVGLALGNPSGGVQTITVNPGLNLVGLTVFPENGMRPTLASVFGKCNTAGLNEGGSSLEADVISIANEEGGWDQYYFVPPGVGGVGGWRKIGQTIGEYSQESWPSTHGMVIDRKGEMPLEIEVSGVPQTTLTELVIRSGMNYFSKVFACEVVLADLELESALVPLLDRFVFLAIVEGEKVETSYSLNQEGAWVDADGVLVDPTTVLVSDVYGIWREPAPPLSVTVTPPLKKLTLQPGVNLLGLTVFPDESGVVTLAHLFSKEGEALLNGGETVDQSDSLRIAVGDDVWEEYFYFDNGLARGWKNVDQDGLLNSDAIQWPVSAGVVFERKGALPISLTLNGLPRVSPTVLRIPRGTHYFSQMYDRELFLKDLDLESVLTVGDEFVELDGPRYVLQANNEWERMSSGEVIDPASIRVPAVYGIQRMGSTKVLSIPPQNEAIEIMPGLHFIPQLLLPANVGNGAPMPTRSLTDLFGEDNAFGLREGNEANADLVWVPKPDGSFDRYYYNRNQGGWLEVGGAIALNGDEARWPVSSGILVERRGNEPLSLPINGIAEPYPTVVTLEQGVNYLNKQDRRELTLHDLELESFFRPMNDEFILPKITPEGVEEGERFALNQNGQWLLVGDPELNEIDPMSISVPDVYGINRSGPPIFF